MNIIASDQCFLPQWQDVSCGMHMNCMQLHSLSLDQHKVGENPCTAA